MYVFLGTQELNVDVTCALFFLRITTYLMKKKKVLLSYVL